MKTPIVLIFAFLTGCSSVDREFAANCKEQRALGAEYDYTKSLCANADQLEDSEKKILVDTWASLKAAKARVKATAEEGRRKGYPE